MKNAFYFMLKVLFVLEISIYLFIYLHFCPDFLIMWKISLIGKRSLISKFITSQTEQQIYNRHIVKYLKNKRQPDNESWSVDRI